MNKALANMPRTKRLTDGSNARWYKCTSKLPA